MSAKDQIKGFINNLSASAAWELCKRLWGPAIVSFAWAIWERLRHQSFDWVGIIGLFLFGAILSLLARKQKPNQQMQTINSAMIPGIPTVSALTGQSPKLNDVDLKDYFKRAHYSTITAEAETNIRVVARNNSPKDVEAFYARLVGIGLVSYWHDVTRFTIYGSQMRLLEELNAKGTLPLSVAQKCYDEAKAKWQKMYSNYSFEQWMSYLKDRSLIVWYPSNMIDITHHGKDFLKYLTHWGIKLAKAY